MSFVSAFYWFLKCTSPGASGGFAPLTPTGALPLDPTRGPWAGPWTPGRKALACSLRIAESDFWDFNVGRYGFLKSALPEKRLVNGLIHKSHKVGGIWTWFWYQIKAESVKKTQKTHFFHPKCHLLPVLWGCLTYPFILWFAYVTTGGSEIGCCRISIYIENNRY